MRKCRWLILSLALLLAAALAAGCGGKPQESQKEEAKEEDKLQIGLSFDSFVIELMEFPSTQKLLQQHLHR